jgi:hypothetical protein
MKLDRHELIETYAQSLLDSMDHKTIEIYVLETLIDHLSSYNDVELVDEIEQFFPEILEK